MSSMPSPTDRPRPDGSDIRRMVPADVPGVARTLAQAFEDDPHFCWIVRDGDGRLRRLERAFAVFASRLWLPHDSSYTHDQLIGAALWLPPGAWHVGALTQLRMGPATARSLGLANTVRLIRVLEFIERRHPRTDHWYLPIIGVASDWQGRGFGAALLRPMLERCDRERLPAYLEASTPRNRALYERHGFEVTDEWRYADDGPPLWPMWREPAP
jgi:GNAT superfamily N-acetyltransferase